MFLSETFVTGKIIEHICKANNFAGWYVVESQRHGGGLALMWKIERGVEVRSSNNHYIDFEVNCEQVGRWRYTRFYGCPERQRKRES